MWGGVGGGPRSFVAYGVSFNPSWPHLPLQLWKISQAGKVLAEDAIMQDQATMQQCMTDVGGGCLLKLKMHTCTERRLSREWHVKMQNEWYVSAFCT